MKKIRITVTFVIVLAVVSSALAFTAKRIGSYCKSTLDNKNVGCAVVHNAFIQTGFPNTFYKKNWNGTSIDCTSTDCPDTVRIIVGND